MDEMGLGKQLQAARQAAHLTQQQLCERANLSFSTLTKIERGAIKSPSIFTIQSIATALNKSLDELVGNGGPSHIRTLYQTKSGVRFIYFDVNGCLVRFFHRAFTLLAQDTGMPSDVVETAFWHYNDDVCRGIITLDEFNAKIAQRLNVDPSSIDWKQYYLKTLEPVPEMQALLVWAAERYQVGLLTNIMPGVLPAMRQSGHLPAINYDAVIDSSEVAAIKPEQKVYEIAQQQTAVKPEQVLLIDDSRANLMAAEQFGWHTLWFDDSRIEESAQQIRAALEPQEQPITD